MKDPVEETNDFLPGIYACSVTYRRKDGMVNTLDETYDVVSLSEAVSILEETLFLLNVDSVISLQIREVQLGEC